MVRGLRCVLIFFCHKGISKNCTKKKTMMQQQILDQLDSLHGREFLEVAEWMKSSATTTLVSEWLASLDVDSRNTKFVLALVYMTHESGTVLDDSSNDQIMRREAVRFRDRLRHALVEDVATFRDDLTRAVRFYRAWMAEDIPRQARVVDETISRLMNEAMRHKINHGTVSEDIVAQIRLLGGGQAEEAVRAQLDRPWERVEDETALQLRIRAMAKRAMTEVLRSHTAQGDYEALFDLLRELQTGMTALMAHSPRAQEDIVDRFDADWIRQQAEAGVLTTAEVHQFVRFLLDTIASFQAPADDARVDEWRRDTEEMLVATVDADLTAFIPEHLVDFLMLAMEHIETVVGRLLNMMNAMD